MDINFTYLPWNNQLAVLPGPWPYTELETIDSKAKWEIEAKGLTSYSKPERSYRQHSCDEFPAASWVEGGIDMPNGELMTVQAISNTPLCYQEISPRGKAKLVQPTVL